MFKKCEICNTEFIPYSKTNKYCSKGCLIEGRKLSYIKRRDSKGCDKKALKTLTGAIWMKKLVKCVRRSGTVEVLPKANTVAELRGLLAEFIIQDLIYRYVNNFKTDAVNRRYELNHICSINYGSEFVPVDVIEGLIPWYVPFKGAYSINNLVIYTRERNTKGSTVYVDKGLIYFRDRIGFSFVHDGVNALTLKKHFLVDKKDTDKQIVAKINQYYGNKLSQAVLNTGLLYKDNFFASKLFFFLRLEDKFKNPIEEQYHIIQALKKKFTRILSNRDTSFNSKNV